MQFSQNYFYVYWKVLVAGEHVYKSKIHFNTSKLFLPVISAMRHRIFFPDKALHAIQHGFRQVILDNHITANMCVKIKSFLFSMFSEHE